ncbi:beta-galactosidase-1-like protein 2 isoform X4 [Ochotona princeps]|uniref:beta-galactosidase-1-like protein 2 isoform X4 n=1 Tax=Ochotona princeps TaxID=9978 RepID=UPI0027153077|nr:beta-galactosidase-1-like protein 2 isoform X4 [Ochotona princeps]
MFAWSLRRKPGRKVGFLLLVVLSFLVLRRLDWRTLIPLWLRHRQLGLTAGVQNFMLEDSTFWIFGGSIHYFRVPREYWRDRLLKMKACGLNTLTTYVPWNLHEPERGKFDFSGNLDLEAFVLMAAEIGLWVILRPGPYICSEIDLGGLPSWLLQDSGMQLRTTYKGFTEAVDLYFDHLMSRVVPLQYKHGGPIIAVQVENEYGSYNKDPAYMPYIKKALEDRGIVELLLTSDNKDGLSKGMIPGVLATINLQSHAELQSLTTLLQSVKRMQPTLVMEYWTGWFDSWGGPHNILDSSGTPLPPPPDLLPKMSYEPMKPSFYLSLWDALQYLEPITSEKPINMESMPVNDGNGQSFGYILYETTITSPGILRGLVRDRGQVFLDTVSIGFMDYKTTQIIVPLIQGYTMLRILVENRGRVNYGDNIDDQRKGVIGNLYLDDSPLKKFRIYSLDLKKSLFSRFAIDKWTSVPEVPVFPAFFLGALLVGSAPFDTFLRLEGWEKGVVFINGKNLGRYWNIGPQKTLYLPGAWLQKGINQVIIFEEMVSGPMIQSTDIPHLGRNQYIH